MKRWWPCFAHLSLNGPIDCRRFLFTVLSTSKIEDCDESIVGMTCNKRLSVVLSLEGGQEAGTETITPLHDASGETRELANPIEITLSKTTPEALFRLRVRTHGTIY